MAAKQGHTDPSPEAADPPLWDRLFHAGARPWYEPPLRFPARPL